MSGDQRLEYKIDVLKEFINRINYYHGQTIIAFKSSHEEQDQVYKNNLNNNNTNNSNANFDNNNKIRVKKNTIQTLEL